LNSWRLSERSERARPEFVHEVMLENITVEDKIRDILDLLQRENRSLAFYRLFPEDAPRPVIVCTLLAILELVKMKLIRVFQMLLLKRFGYLLRNCLKDVPPLGGYVVMAGGTVWTDYAENSIAHSVTP